MYLKMGKCSECGTESVLGGNCHNDKCSLNLAVQSANDAIYPFQVMVRVTYLAIEVAIVTLFIVLVVKCVT